MKGRIRNYFKVGLLILLVIGCEVDYLSYEQQVVSPDGQFNYCLYLDNVGGMDYDPGYYVLKLDKKIDPKNLNIKWSYKTGTKTEDLEWLRQREVLFNYDEGGLLTANPKIEIFNKRHLVISRGGLYFGLFDLKLQKDTLGSRSPYNLWREKSNYQGEHGNRAEEEELYRKWIKENIHDKIKSYINQNK